VIVNRIPASISASLDDDLTSKPVSSLLQGLLSIELGCACPLFKDKLKSKSWATVNDLLLASKPSTVFLRHSFSSERADGCQHLGRGSTFLLEAITRRACSDPGCPNVCLFLIPQPARAHATWTALLVVRPLIPWTLFNSRSKSRSFEPQHAATSVLVFVSGSPEPPSPPYLGRCKRRRTPS
jgi:hypothetical protein